VLPTRARVSNHQSIDQSIEQRPNQDARHTYPRAMAQSQEGREATPVHEIGLACGVPLVGPELRRAVDDLALPEGHDRRRLVGHVARLHAAERRTSGTRERERESACGREDTTTPQAPHVHATEVALLLVDVVDMNRDIPRFLRQPASQPASTRARLVSLTAPSLAKSTTHLVGDLLHTTERQAGAQQRHA